MKIDGLFNDLRVGENIAKSIRVSVEPEFERANIKVLFLSPGGVSILTNTIAIESREGEYALPRIILDDVGILQAQIYAYDGTEVLAKSAIYQFRVKPSLDINGVVEPDVEEYYDPGEVSNRLDVLEAEPNVLYESQELTDEQKTQVRENIGAGEPYTLPVATWGAIGGVMPYSKTESMTEHVGVDENGILYYEPYDDSDVVKSVNSEVPDDNGNVVLFIPENISDLSDDATHRTVSDAQIDNWNGKLDRIESAGLGVYTHNGTEQSEVGVANSITSGDTKLATADAVYNYVDAVIGDADSILDRIIELIGGDEP